MNRLRQIFRDSRELTILVPVTAVLLLLALWAVSALTGRPVAVSLVPLVEFSINLIRAVLCGAFAAMFQASALGYRAEKSGGTIADDIHDAGVYVVFWLVLLHYTSVF